MGYGAFFKAGGIPRVIENMQKLMDTEVLTCTGSLLSDNISNFEYSYPANEEVIKTPEEPFGYLGGIAVLEGNLAPDTGICKPRSYCA